jgi:aminoglycoside phosphotransferase (APT) family kinase protein
VLTSWRDRPLADLLAAHDLTGLPERDFPTDGWSGATFTTIDRGDRRFVLKRISLATDWIAVATRDQDRREAWIATVGREARLPTPYLDAAADGDDAIVLMPDLSVELIAWERSGPEPAMDDAVLDRVLRAIAELHATPWSRALGMTAPADGRAHPPPWCPLPERLTLLTRPSATRYAAAGNPVGERFLAGWDAFERLAPAAARRIVEELSADPAPIVTALERLPFAGLHGDLKLANVAIFDDGDVAFIDWQMTMEAPVAVELGWFLVSNTDSLPTTAAETLAAYQAAAAAVSSGVGEWDAQVDLAMLVGILLRGWRKGLDTAAGAVLASGMAAEDDLAWWCDRAVAAARRL